MSWRLVATKRLSPTYEILDPMRRDFRGSEVGNESVIVEADKRDINTSDAVLVNALRPSWGTAMEVLYAYDQKKRVIAFVGHQRPSPWLKYHCKYVGTHLEDATTFLLAGLR